MKINDKRKVIEVLLCAAQTPDDFAMLSTWDAARQIDCVDVRFEANSIWSSVANDVDLEFRTGHHGTVCLEAAYRLIESSPTLRREWFGGGR